MMLEVSKAMAHNGIILEFRDLPVPPADNLKRFTFHLYSVRPQVLSTFSVVFGSSTGGLSRRGVRLQKCATPP